MLEGRWGPLPAYVPPPAPAHAARTPSASGSAASPAACAPDEARTPPSPASDAAPAPAPPPGAPPGAPWAAPWAAPDQAWDAARMPHDVLLTPGPPSDGGSSAAGSGALYGVAEAYLRALTLVGADLALGGLDALAEPGPLRACGAAHVVLLCGEARSRAPQQRAADAYARAAHVSCRSELLCTLCHTGTLCTHTCPLHRHIQVQAHEHQWCSRAQHA